MRAPSKRVTFVVAFLVANLLLFFPFASEANEELPGPEEAAVDDLEEVESPADLESSADETEADAAGEGETR